MQNMCIVGLINEEMGLIFFFFFFYHWNNTGLVYFDMGISACRKLTTYTI